MRAEDDILFKNALETKDFFNIKSGLVDYIIRVNGNESLVNEAIEMAIKSGCFNWEEDDNISFLDKNKDLKYNYLSEKARLVQNFSEKRYQNFMKLYRAYKLPPEKTLDSAKKVMNSKCCNCNNKNNATQKVNESNNKIILQKSSENKIKKLIKNIFGVKNEK